MRRFVTVVLSITCVATAALGQSSVLAPITEPIWVSEPSRPELPYPFAASDFREQVSLSCEVRAGALTDCRPVDLTPANFLAAAIAAVHDARLAPQDGAGQSTEGRRIVTNLRFPVPTPVAAPRRVPPTWLERPGSDDVIRHYPPAALAAGVGGQVILDCLIDAEGRLACTVHSEEPSGYLFGDAAVQISQYFRVTTQASDGRSTVGERVRVPIRFNPGRR